ncbi:MAG TPA: hypothetical protein VH280_15760 [Verrucomicrobiae bacterium]|jgi:hypothetical protein|nr:hypothetical protein [Verrucomicrobiae bacterium]
MKRIPHSAFSSTEFDESQSRSSHLLEICKEQGNHNTSHQNAFPDDNASDNLPGNLAYDAKPDIGINSPAAHHPNTNHRHNRNNCTDSKYGQKPWAENAGRAKENSYQIRNRADSAQNANKRQNNGTAIRRGWPYIQSDCRTRRRFRPDIGSWMVLSLMTLVPHSQEGDSY